ncbi:hypothetical protein DERF_000850 [Dermatophagoides farinae]|uniref:Uncharacterized protein n=1 Tax=Dermatophagoides farinae TaxID=6954 RepID=A0A922KU02_DERFA|nr:hypothetical protein DERF_014267 [Dermatophagoides farinae]KAH9526788.1 hypothetical protein DERF_000850 [Dermatophagoides farinae]
MFSNFRLLLGLLKFTRNLPSRSFTVSLILIPCCAGITLLVISRLVSSASSLPVIVTTVFKHGSLLQLAIAFFRMPEYVVGDCGGGGGGSAVAHCRRKFVSASNRLYASSTSSCRSSTISNEAMIRFLVNSSIVLPIEPTSSNVIRTNSISRLVVNDGRDMTLEFVDELLLPEVVFGFELAGLYGVLVVLPRWP